MLVTIPYALPCQIESASPDGFVTWLLGFSLCFCGDDRDLPFLALSYRPTLAFHNCGGDCEIPNDNFDLLVFVFFCRFSCEFFFRLCVKLTD